MGPFYAPVMPESSTLFVFTAAAMLLFIVPGPAVLYIVTRSLSQGRKAGLISVLGIHAGSLVHIIGAAIGLSALIAASATAFTAVRWAGAAYLIYLGVRTLRSDASLFRSDMQTPDAYRRIFFQGMIVNVLNPKTAVFFLAFVPQFIDPERGSTTLQIAVLGTAFVLAGLVSDGIYALAAGTLGDWFAKRPAWRTGSKYAAGSIYLALGATAALSTTPSRSV